MRAFSPNRVEHVNTKILVKGYSPFVASKIVDAKLEAETILHEAEIKASNILNEVKKNAKTISEEARLKALSDLQDEAARTIAEARNWVRTFREEMLWHMKEAVLAVAERIWGEVVDKKEEATFKILSELRNELQSRGELCVRVHPADLKALESVEGIRVETDESLSSGDCIVEAGAFLFDARAGVRAKLALDALARSLGSTRYDGVMDEHESI